MPNHENPSFDFDKAEEEFNTPELKELAAEVADLNDKGFSSAELDFTQGVNDQIDTLLLFSPLVNVITNELEVGEDEEPEEYGRSILIKSADYPDLFKKYNLSKYADIYMSRLDDGESALRFVRLDEILHASPDSHYNSADPAIIEFEHSQGYDPEDKNSQKGYTLKEFEQDHFGYPMDDRDDAHLQFQDEVTLMDALKLVEEASKLAAQHS